jgi:two-component system sensor histidine kinase KdpD
MRAGTKTTRDWLIGVAIGAGAVAAVTIAIELIDDVVPVLSLGVLYVFAVLLVAIFWGPLVAVPVAVASMLAFNFFFLPPVYTFTLADRSNWLALAVYVVVAIVVGTLASRYRSGKAEAEQREREAALLADIAADLLRGAQLEDGLRAIEERTATVLGVSSVRIALGERAKAPSHSSPHPLTVEGRTIGTLDTPENEEPILATQRRFLPALASLLGVAIEREKLEREAREADNLRRSDTVKTAVIQAVSHDLRTPLATIEQALDGLESGELELTEDDRTALLETIRAEHSRLKRLVENLLDLSRIQAQATDAHPQVWTIEELVSQALEELAGAERVVVTAPDELPPVRVDAVQVQRALANVLENALRVSPSSEPVNVRLTATRRDVLVRVTDRGPGIPEEEWERIFEPFHRVAGRPDQPGAGLGLAIARGFTEANGGRMWLESREGQGASFVLAFPLVELPAPAPAPA